MNLPEYVWLTVDEQTQQFKPVKPSDVSQMPHGTVLYEVRPQEEEGEVTFTVYVGHLYKLSQHAIEQTHPDWLPSKKAFEKENLFFVSRAPYDQNGDSVDFFGFYVAWLDDDLKPIHQHYERSVPKNYDSPEFKWTDTAAISEMLDHWPQSIHPSEAAPSLEETLLCSFQMAALSGAVAMLSFVLLSVALVILMTMTLSPLGVGVISAAAAVSAGYLFFGPHTELQAGVDEALVISNSY